MKKLLVIPLLLLFALPALAQQKGMQLIPDSPAEVMDTITLDATVQFSAETEAMIISQNNRDVFQVNHNNELQEGVQYWFALVTKNCNRCLTVRPAKVLFFTKSRRQVTREIVEFSKHLNLD